MSDSETAGRPSDAAISRTLRHVVVAIHKTGKIEDLTVKRVRAKAEEQLGLSTGFLKTSQEWKQKSHNVILEAVETYCGDDPASDPEPKSKPKPKPKAKPSPKKSTKTNPPPKKAKTANESANGVKRKSAIPVKKPPKRRKTAVSSDEESDVVRSELSAKEDTPSDTKNESPKKVVRRGGKKRVIEDSDEEDVAPKLSTSKIESKEERLKPALVPAKEQEITPSANMTGDVSDSEMSILIDESPAKKKQPKKVVSKKGGKEPKSKTSAAAEPKVKAPKHKAEDSPDQAEIKRLQSWLVKCGIRKVWVKELANCDTAKDKIKHLKEMLKDAGMDGKYSNEKAVTIKEQREFAKDLEAIQEGAKAWGEIGEDSGRPRRRLARGPPKPLPKYEDEDEKEDDKFNVDASIDEGMFKTNDQENNEESVKPKAKKDGKAKPQEGDDDSDEDVEFDNDDSNDEVGFVSEDDDDSDAGDNSD